MAAHDSGWLNGSCSFAPMRCAKSGRSTSASSFSSDTDLGLPAPAGWQSALCRTARVVHHGHQMASQASVGSRMGNKC